MYTMSNVYTKELLLHLNHVVNSSHWSYEGHIFYGYNLHVGWVYF